MAKCVTHHEGCDCHEEGWRKRLDMERAEILSLRAENIKLKTALNDIAAWDFHAYGPQAGSQAHSMRIARKALASNSDDYKAHHCKHGTRGIYCFDFHPRHEREKCDAARDAAFKTQQDSAKVMQKTSEVNDRLHEMGLQSRREDKNGK